MPSANPNLEKYAVCTLLGPYPQTRVGKSFVFMFPLPLRTESEEGAEEGGVN